MDIFYFSFLEAGARRTGVSFSEVVLRRPLSRSGSVRAGWIRRRRRAVNQEGPLLQHPYDMRDGRRERQGEDGIKGLVPGGLNCISTAPGRPSARFITLKGYKDGGQTWFSAPSLLGRRVLDLQGPLARRRLPPVVSAHEFPPLKSLGGVVVGPKAQVTNHTVAFKGQKS